MKLRGVIVPVATPLTPGRTPDLLAFRRLLDYLLDAGVHGIFANGSMGAFALMSDSQQCAIVEAAASHVAGRLPVLAGVSDTGVARVVEKIRGITRQGIDAVVVLPPFFYPCNQEELLRFYLLIAEAAEKPVILYDNPRLARTALEVKTIARLAAHPNIRGIKLSGTDVLEWQELLRAPIDRAHFALISGAGRMTNLALQLGFDGITEGLHNIIPTVAVELYTTQRAGRFAEGDRIQQRINRCFGVFDVAGGWRGLEVALQALKIAGHAAPPPYDEPIDPAMRQRILAVLAAEGIA